MTGLGSGLGQVALVGVWFLGAVVVMRLGWALTSRLLPGSSPLAAPLGLPLGLAVVWVVSFWVGHVVSLFVAALLGLGVLVGAAVLARRTDSDRSLVPAGFTAAVAVFAVAFFFMLAIRALDPAVHPLGGEKFLDFGLLNSLARTRTLPPEDMWFAGEPVSYYYGGHLLVSQIARLTATPPEYAYNIALAGFYGMLVTCAYGIAAGIADRVAVPHRLAGASAAFFVGVASNLATPINLVFALLPSGVATDLAEALGYQLTGLAGGLEDFSYWTASRVIRGTINEFPLFAWLNGDMHGHMMSTSFTLLVVGLLAAYAWSPPERRWRRRLIVLGLVPPVAGMIAVINTWSFPTIGGLVVLGLYFATPSPGTLLPQRIGARLNRESVLGTEALRLLVAGVLGVIVLGIGILWSTPFWVESATSRPLGLFPERSPLGSLLVVHGVFVLLFGSYLLRMAGARAVEARRGAILGLLVVALGASAGLLALTVLVLLIVLGWFSLRATDLREGLRGSSVGRSGRQSVPDGGQSRLPRPGFETVLIVAGLGLILIVEFAHVDEGGAFPRYNTVFKVYMQVWILLGTAAGVVLARFLSDHHPDLPLSGREWRPVLRGMAALIIVTTSIYGGFALVSHVHGTTLNAGTGPTLDATAFVDAEHPEEAAAIAWIDDLDGQPNIVTAAPGGYQWTPSQGHGASAPASLTGVPTVLGWFHEAQYRGEEVYRPRLEDVRTIYTGSDAAQRRPLQAYAVEYVYVGPAERAQYGTLTIGDHPAVSVATEYPAVTIYAVDQGALD